MIDDWSTQISGGVGQDMGGVFSVAYAELQRFVRRPGIESDMRMLSPLEYHFSATELGQLLRKGHYGVALDEESWERLVAWHDLNAPYHGAWRETHPRQAEHAPAMAARALELRREFAPAGPFVNTEDMPKGPAYDRAFVAPQPVSQTNPPAPDGAEGVFDAAAAAKKQRAAAIVLGDSARTAMSVDLGGGVALELALIPGGAFLMGASDGHPDEQPVAQTSVKPFWMGRFEVTNEQFRRFNPSHESRDESRHGYQFGRRGFPMDDPMQPAVRLSWEEAMAFCHWLSEKTGMKATLPTEAQWEWAARAGADAEQAFNFGSLESDFSANANFADISLRDFAQCTAREHYSKAEPIQNPSRHDDRIPRCDRFDDGAMISTEVGRYRPNAWGLHDMHGNVWEWTRSAYLPYPYQEQDGRSNAESDAPERVARGGSWRDRPFRGALTYRLPYRPDQRVFNVGFRVATELH